MWIAIWICVGFALWFIGFLAMRELVLWYLRVPERITLMEEIRDELRSLNAKQTGVSDPAVFTWRGDR